MSKYPKKYGVPYGTIRNKINSFSTKKHGGQTALSNELEEVLVKNLDQLIGKFHLMAMIYDASCSLALSPLGNIKADLGICQDQIGLEIL